MSIIPRILRAKFEAKESELDKLDKISSDMKEEFRGLTAQEVKAVAK